ncbi:phage/plasmid primase, P4 family [Helicobacter japonicus]|uniref:phage/plasmid primase, P4 family n=1 Tax=Helicobacter japonicus TaxID=425400 RepID=UPI002628CE90|nr:phage/plasmid primase, P4 family [Helicobacter japonicus]
MNDMKKMTNWVCHKNKIPIDPKTGNAAKSNDPSTWGTYEQAQECIKKDPSLSGLGFMFSHSPYVGIDIDHCIKDGKLNELAKEIISTMNSYTEVSYSGTGVHIICKGKLAGAGKKNSALGLEMYDTGRYFTVTEKFIKEYKVVEARQQEIDQLYQSHFAEKKNEIPAKQQPIYHLEDEKIVEIASKSQNSSKFLDLYAGNWQNAYHSQSEADLALCNILAFYTGRNGDQMDRIFRTSGLMRPKWDEIHGLQTYGNATITKAIEDCNTVYEPSAIRDFKDVVIDEIEQQPQSLSAPVEPPKPSPLDRFHRFNGKGQITGVFDAEICDYILETEDIVVVGGMVYVYHNGVYQVDSQGAYLKNKIKSLIYKDFQKAYTINNVYQLLLMNYSLYKSYSEVNQYPKLWINFRNGMLDVKTLELLPHDPKYLAMNQIPHDWMGADYDYQHKYSDYFLSTSLNQEDVQTLFEYMGYCMTRSTRFQIFLLLKGEGDNGKSIVIDLFNAVIGEQNISSIGMDKLTERFFSAQLLFKLCNTCADISKVTIEDDSELKKIIAGDMIQTEFKGQNSFDFRPYVKLFFSANRFPYVDDRSEGFKRRLRVIDMTKKPSKKDRDLTEKLIEEIDYWVFSAVLYLNGALQNDEIKESEISKEAKEELHKESDSVYAFIKDCLIEIEGQNIKRAEMYQEYEKYCRFYDRGGLTKKAFFAEMQAKGFAVQKYAGIFIYKNCAFSTWEIDNSDLEPHS